MRDFASPVASASRALVAMRPDACVIRLTRLSIQKNATKRQDESATPNVMEPSRVSVLKGVPIVAVCGGPSAAHCAAIAEDGRAFVWGATRAGSSAWAIATTGRSPPSSSRSPFPRAFGSWTAPAASRTTVLITSDGDAYAFGSNKHGQLGVGAIAKKPKGEDDLRLAPVQCAGVSGATAVACGAEFTAWICAATAARCTPRAYPSTASSATARTTSTTWRRAR